MMQLSQVARVVSGRPSRPLASESVSGVSTDEEAMNLINYQQQYQAAARLISIAQELTQTLMQLV